MTRSEFLLELQEMLQTETELHAETKLSELEEWDSLSFMVLIAFFDKNFSIRVSFEELEPCKNPEAIIALSKGAIE